MLCCPLGSFGCGLRCFLCLLFRGKLLLHLEGDSIGVHLIDAGCVMQNCGGIRSCGGKHDGGLYHQPGEGSFVGTTKKCTERFRQASIVALLPDAMLPRQCFDAALVHQAYQLLKDEKQVTLHQTDRDSGAHSRENTKAGCVGYGLLLPLLLLLGLPLRIVAAGLRLGMMHRAGWIGTHLVDGANVRAFRDDGLGGELAHFELRPLRVVFRFRLVVPNRGVLVARQYRTAFFLSTVGRADLHQFRLRRYGLSDVSRDLRLIAVGVGASVALPAEVIAKQQLVMPRPLGAVGATSRRGNKLRIPLVERSILEDEQDVRVNPELQVADGQQDTGRFLTAVVYLLEAGRESLFLLVGW